jgi:hypothetical protein
MGSHPPLATTSDLPLPKMTVNLVGRSGYCYSEAEASHLQGACPPANALTTRKCSPGRQSQDMVLIEGGSEPDYRRGPLERVTEFDYSLQ